MNCRAIGRTMLLLGALGLILGVGPLLVVAIINPKSNAIGLGLLAVFSFVPSIALLIFGWLTWLTGCMLDQRRMQPQSASLEAF